MKVLATSPAPVPPSPHRAALGFRAFFKLEDAKRRWPFATRAAICTGVPVLVGWLAGDTGAGLLATIGAFTALYGSDRPYLNRALYLAVVAAALAAAVTLGIWASSEAWSAVVVVTMIATVAAFLCSALRVGPPGAYMFALACAAGTAIPAHHLSTAQSGLLVLCGGTFAWLVHMSGALFSPRGPERAAVANAGEAVARFIEAAATPRQDIARHAAALAIHDAWTMLVARQPARPRPDGTLSWLRSLNRELHLLFAQIMNDIGHGTPLPQATVERARMIARQARNPPPDVERTDPQHVPLGHPGVLQSLREAVKPWSNPTLIAMRVGLATCVAGAIGAELGLERAYWTMAAAVLVLYQGFAWVRTLQRGLQRVIGTLVGLILAGAVLLLHPEGLWLVCTLMVLQFTIEICVVRNYALAVVFITAAALTIAAGGHQVPDVAHLLWVRGMDTVIGCTVGLVVFALTTPRVIAVPVPRELIQTLDAVGTVIRYLVQGTVTTPLALVARRDLQHRTIALLQAYDASVGAASRHRESAEKMWPAVVAAQRLAYRVLTVCWTLETAADAPQAAARTLFGSEGEKQVLDALAGVKSAIATGETPMPSEVLPAFLQVELSNLQKSLVGVIA